MSPIATAVELVPLLFTKGLHVAYKPIILALAAAALFLGGAVTNGTNERLEVGGLVAVVVLLVAMTVYYRRAKRNLSDEGEARALVDGTLSPDVEGWLKLSRAGDLDWSGGDDSYSAVKAGETITLRRKSRDTVITVTSILAGTASVRASALPERSRDALDDLWWLLVISARRQP